MHILFSCKEGIAEEIGVVMKKGQMIEGTVERIDFPNKGIVRTEDGVCVVKNALPGQKVKAGINKVRKGAIIAMMIQNRQMMTPKVKR